MPRARLRALVPRPSPHIPCLRAPTTRTLPTKSQRRWAQVLDVRFVATTPPRRSVLEKYREKLDRKAKLEGYADMHALKNAYAEKIAQVRREAAAGGGTALDVKAADAIPRRTAASRPAAGSTVAAEMKESGIKRLSSLLDVSKVRTLPLGELTAIWRRRHASDPQSLCAVVPVHAYAAMEQAARHTSAQFVLPVPHPEHGAEMHFLQWTWNHHPPDPDSHAGEMTTSTVLFTQLAEYKLRGEFASAHTTVTHYLDLVGDRGLVLMAGRVSEGRGVSVQEGKWLVLNMQRFYGGWDGAKLVDVLGERMGNDDVASERMAERRRLLEWFGKGDRRFSVERLMEEVERVA